MIHRCFQRAPRLTALGAYVFVVLMLLGTRANAQGVRSDVLDRTFEVGTTGRFHLDSERGTVEVAVDEGRTVRVEVEREARRGYDLADFAVTFEQRGGDVFVRGRFKNPDRYERARGDVYRVRYRITVPRRFDATLATSVGHVTVGDLGGDLDVRSAAAHLRLGQIGGRVTAETSAGHISLDGAGGDTRLETSAGNVVAGHVRGDLAVRSSAGNVTAERVDGDFRAITSAGNIVATVTRPPSRDTRLETSAGNISLRVPQGSGFVVDAAADGGRANVGFPRTSRGYARAGRAVVHQTVGAGGPTVTLRTSTGNISVVPAR